MPQLWIGFPLSVASARLAFQATADVHGLVHEKWAKNGDTLLHAAVQKLCCAKTNMHFGYEHFSEPVEPIISDILAVGADVHALDDRGCSPFGYLIADRWSLCGENFYQLLLSWFALLRQYNYDLQDYLLSEINQCPTVFTIDVVLAGAEYFQNSDLALKPPSSYETDYKTSFHLEIPKGTNDMILEFTQERMFIQEPETIGSDRILPGSWLSEYDEELPGDSYMTIEGIRNRSIHGMRFFIGPLINGVQEFGRLEKRITKAI